MGLFPPDVVRLFAMHLDGDAKSNKADVANLAATCQAWRKALMHHVKRHRLMFPKIRLTESELNLQQQRWKTRFKMSLMGKMRRFNLRYDESDCWGLEYRFVYDGDGYHVYFGFPQSWGSTTKYITFLPQDGSGLTTIFKPHIMVEDEWLYRWNRAMQETRDLVTAWDEAWIQCGGLAGK